MVRQIMILVALAVLMTEVLTLVFLYWHGQTEFARLMPNEDKLWPFFTAVVTDVLLPQLLFFPLLMALIYGALKQGLKPITRFSKAIVGLTGFNRTRMLTEPLPDELQPIQGAVNKLIHHNCRMRTKGKREIFVLFGQLREAVESLEDALKTIGLNRMPTSQLTQREVNVLNCIDKVHLIFGQFSDLEHVQINQYRHGAVVDIIAESKQLSASFKVVSDGIVTVNYHDSSCLVIGVKGTLILMLKYLFIGLLPWLPQFTKLVVDFSMRSATLSIVIEVIVCDVLEHQLSSSNNQGQSWVEQQLVDNIGYAIIKTVVERHAGNIVLLEQPGKLGALITLPCIANEPAISEEKVI